MSFYQGLIIVRKRDVIRISAKGRKPIESKRLDDRFSTQ
jgi:hypothetical protein